MTENANLAALNAMPAQLAEAALLACCGSTRWARRMVLRRPFDQIEDLLAASDHIWGELAPEDWREAFSRHPKIGESTGQVARELAPKDDTAQAQAWSAQEQSAVRMMSELTRAALAEANRVYEERFGYIFIVCATGKTAEEMLAILRQRLQNDPDTELQIAAEEQRQITELRLKKFLGV